MAKGSIRKVLVVVSAVVVVGSTVAMWSLNHGFMAWLNAIISGGIIIAALRSVFGKEDNATGALIAAIIAAAISITFYSKNSIDYNVEKAQEKAAVVAKQQEKAAAEQARLDALTPEERKQEEFVKARTFYGSMLAGMIKSTAFDPDALKLKSPEYYKNGVCIQANGKNRFGAYVGWQEHCYLLEGDKWKYSGPN
jgi:hypothetical protein